MNWGKNKKNSPYLHNQTSAKRNILKPPSQTSWLTEKAHFLQCNAPSVCFLSSQSLSPSCSFIIICFLCEADKETLTHTHVQLAQHVTGLKAGDLLSCCVTHSHSCRWLSLRRPSPTSSTEWIICPLSISDSFSPFLMLCLSATRQYLQPGRRSALLDMEIHALPHLFMPFLTFQICFSDSFALPHYMFMSLSHLAR